MLGLLWECNLNWHCSWSELAQILLHSVLHTSKAHCPTTKNNVRRQDPLVVDAAFNYGLPSHFVDALIVFTDKPWLEQRFCTPKALAACRYDGVPVWQCIAALHLRIPTRCLLFSPIFLSYVTKPFPEL